MGHFKKGDYLTMRQLGENDRWKRVFEGQIGRKIPRGRTQS